MRVDDLVGVSDAERPRLQRHLNDLVGWRDEAAFAVRGAIESLYDQRNADPTTIRVAAAIVGRMAARAEQRDKEIADFIANPRIP